MQSNLSSKLPVRLQDKLHVGIIMDGNGRWATRRGLSRLRGHEAGVEAIRRVVEAAPAQGIGTLTLYAFSADNWRRPKAEVTGLMALLRFYLANEIQSLVENGVRLTVIGRRDRLPDGIAAAIGRAESATASCGVLHLRIAVDYSAREAILNAAARLAGAVVPTRELFSELVTGQAGLRATSISSSERAARSDCPTSCSGRAPMPSCISPSGCGPSSTPTISPRLSPRSIAVIAGLAA